jgi:hypothetical protein
LEEIKSILRGKFWEKIDIYLPDLKICLTISWGLSESKVLEIQSHFELQLEQ